MSGLVSRFRSTKTEVQAMVVEKVTKLDEEDIDFLKTKSKAQIALGQLHYMLTELL